MKKLFASIKKLFAVLFFTDDPARGAVFALTLLTIGGFLWFSLCCLAALATGDIVYGFVLFCCGWVALIPYTMKPVAEALVDLLAALWRRRTLWPLAWLIPAGAWLAAGGIVVFRTLPLATYIWLAVYDPNFRHTPLDTGLGTGFPGLPPTWWAAVFLLSLLLLLAGGLMLAAMFAAAAKRPFRSLFGKATLTLWGLLAVWQLVFLGMALYESREAAAVYEAVERRFGRPLTAAGLEAMYRESGTIDADFWKRHDECHDAVGKIEFPDKETFLLFCGIELPDRPTAEILAWYGRFCRENRAALEAWEACFDRVPPLPAKNFPPGRLVFEPWPEFDSCPSFMRMERSRLILALSLGDVEAAWACYRRMSHASALFRKEPPLLGSLVWIALENMRLSGVEKMLESRLFSDARLDDLAADLTELEREIPRNHLQAMYAEAVFVQDLFLSLEERFFAAPDADLPLVALAPYRWIFPQFWYHAASDKKKLLQNFLQPDFTFTPSSPPKASVLSILNIFPFYGLDNAGKCFYVLTARTRGMQTLLRAERYRRAHGDFPPTLDDLPEDPFTGKALIYEIGPAEIKELVWEKPVSSSEKWVKTAVEAVQVRSDPAKALAKHLRDPEKGTDRTRALLRLDPAMHGD